MYMCVCVCIRSGEAAKHGIKQRLKPTTPHNHALSASFGFIMKLTQLQQHKICLWVVISNYHQPCTIVADSDSTYGVPVPLCH